MESANFLEYLQQVLKEHDMESSILELAAICERYGIERIEDLQPDTIAGIHATLTANRQQTSDDSRVGFSGSSLATIMKQKFQKKVEAESQQIVQDYQNIPTEIQEAVIKTMMTEYIKKNPKIDEFLAEADYAKISEQNIQNSQQMLKYILGGLLGILVLLAGANLLDSFANLIHKPERVVYVDKK